MVINYSCVHTQDTCAFLQADMYDMQIDHKVPKVEWPKKDRQD